MDLYFSPLACSLATRIALYEAGATANFLLVDKAKRLADGTDYLAINPLGLVPVLRTDEGALLRENGAILLWVADRFPEAKLAPASGLARARLHQWLSFLGTEIHRGIFGPLLDPKGSPEGAKDYARSKIPSRFGMLSDHLAGREHILDQFSVADAYLVPMLNWTFATGIPLTEHPVLQTYYRRLLERPSVASANAEERALYAREQAAPSRVRS